MLKKFIKTHIIKAKYFRLLFKYLRLNIMGFFPKKFQISSNNSKNNKIIIFSSIGGHTYYSRFDRLLERCFNLLNYEVIIVLCNSELDICQEFTHEVSNKNKISNNFKNLYCYACKKHGLKLFKNSNIKYLGDYSKTEFEKITLKFNEFISNNLEDYQKFKTSGICFGEHIKAGLVRYYGGYTDIEKDKFYKENILKFAHAAFKTFLSVSKIIELEEIHLSILHHAIYIPQGVISDTLKLYNISFYSYSMSYRSKTFFFAYGDTYHKNFLELKNWENYNFKNKNYETLKDYFDNKSINNQDWIDFTTKNDSKKFQHLKEKTKQFKKENIFVMYTNVTWDAQIHFKNNIFSNIFEWIDMTIEYFQNNPNKLLVIRSHPAEVYGNVQSRDSIYDYILKNHGNNQSNVIIIKPLDSINSYKLMSITDNFLIYSSKISIELLFYNKKILIAGEAFVRGKGFTLDVKNKNEYFNNLNDLKIFNLDENTRLKSYKFIYFFFFKLMIRVHLLSKENYSLNHPFTFDEFSYEEFAKDEGFFKAINQMIAKDNLISH